LHANPTFQMGRKTSRMAHIYPFRAWRYNPSAVRLEDVVTQPYDKITPAMQQAYYDRSPYNLVRIILGKPELFDASGAENVYTRAARDFWRRRSRRRSLPTRNALDSPEVKLSKRDAALSLSARSTSMQTRWSSATSRR